MPSCSGNYILMSFSLRLLDNYASFNGTLPFFFSISLLSFLDFLFKFKILIFDKLFISYHFELYIANNMDPNQTVPVDAVCIGFILIAVMINVVCGAFMIIKNAKSRQYLQTKILAG